MSRKSLKLLLPELEAEVLSEALELYLRVRPAPGDARFEYRYRAAQSVLDVLQRSIPDDDDPPPGRRHTPVED
jgi:hypothetical protein